MLALLLFFTANVKRISNHMWSIKDEARSFRRAGLCWSNPRLGGIHLKQTAFHPLSPNRITRCHALIQQLIPFMSWATLQTCSPPVCHVYCDTKPLGNTAQNQARSIVPAGTRAGGCGMHIRCQQQSHNRISINSQLLRPIVVAVNPQHSF